MLKRIAIALWGKFQSREEVQKFVILGGIFFLIIGIYWAMRPIKDSIFGSVVGVDYTPYAKFLSLFIVTPLVLLYTKLVDMFPRAKVFYMLIVAYTIIALLCAAVLNHPYYGLANPVESPWRIIGWIWYVYVESFGSLMVALFWAITTDTTDEDAAKRGFPIIALLGQTGNIVGPFLLTAKRWGFANSAPIIFIIAAMTALAGVLMWVFMRVTPKHLLVGYQAEQGASTEHSEPGFLEGLKLLLTKPYLAGIFIIGVMFEIIITIIDFFFKATAKAAFPIERDYAHYLSTYAVMTGVVATTCVLLGINNIQRYLGTVASLILTPAIFTILVIWVKLNPVLIVLFWVMVIGKAINYALNQPTIKQLYIPTTKDAKYKSQAWIEMFGSRLSKAGGSGVNTLRLMLKGKYGAAGATMFLSMSTGISLGLIVVWLFAVVYLARVYTKAVDQKRVVC